MTQDMQPKTEPCANFCFHMRSVPDDTARLLVVLQGLAIKSMYSKADSKAAEDPSIYEEVI